MSRKTIFDAIIAAINRRRRLSDERVVRDEFHLRHNDSTDKSITGTFKSADKEFADFYEAVTAPENIPSVLKLRKKKIKKNPDHFREDL